MPFNILPLNEGKKEIFPFSPSIPQPQNGNFRLCICGQSGSGKSVLLINLLKEYRKFYKKIVVFSPNVSQFKLNFGSSMSKHDMLYEKFDSADIKKHFKKSMARNRTDKKRQPMILVFDDTLDILQKDPFFKRMMLISRKENVSLVFTTHKFTFISPLIRQNLTHLVLLSSTKRELQLVAAYIGSDKDALVENYFESAAVQRFNFLYIILNPLTVILNFSDKQLI